MKGDVYRYGRLLAALLVGCAAMTGSSFAQVIDDTLPRRASLGVTTNQQASNVVVLSVRSGSAAEKAGLKADDTLLALNDKSISTSTELLELLRVTPSGSKATIKVKRGDQTLTLDAILDGVATEELAGQQVTYGSVLVPPSGNTTQPYRVRTIVTMPQEKSVAKRPVFVFLQGIYCASIDRPAQLQAADTRLVHAMAQRGFVTLRVDKAGLGDSQGPACGDLDFTSELTAYIEAIKQVKQLEGVDADRVYVFGHSMGGVMVPFVAQATPLRGAIVYGTLARTWLEYTLENTRRQMQLIGATPGEVTDSVRNTARLFGPVFVDKLTPGHVWAKHPELKEAESPMLDARRIASRDATFYHQLQDLNIAQAWADAQTNVLALHGEFDWVSSKEDHDMIASIVASREGAVAESRTIMFADHGLTSHLTQQMSIAKMGQGKELEQLPQVVHDWIVRVEGGARSLAPDTADSTVAAALQASDIDPAPATFMSLAESWAQFAVGTWQGAVTTNIAGKLEEGEMFEMALRVERTPDPKKFDWILEYNGSAGKQVRSYTLIVDGERVSIDENNGVVLPASLIGNTLHTMFEIDSAHIAAMYELIEPGTEYSRVTFTLTSSSQVTTSKDEMADKNVPSVKAWLPTTTQRAELMPKR